MSDTPSEVWAAKIVTCKEKCREIVSSSSSVRFAIAINEFGRTLTGASQGGMRPLLSRVQARNEFYMISALLTLRKANSDALGVLNHAVIRHSNVSILVFLRGEITYYISLNPSEEDIAGMVSIIKKLI